MRDQRSIPLYPLNNQKGEDNNQNHGFWFLKTLGVIPVLDLKKRIK
jgi:hypothetical protein